MPTQSSELWGVCCLWLVNSRPSGFSDHDVVTYPPSNLAFRNSRGLVMEVAQLGKSYNHVDFPAMFDSYLISWLMISLYIPFKSPPFLMTPSPFPPQKNAGRFGAVDNCGKHWEAIFCCLMSVLVLVLPRP